MNSHLRAQIRSRMNLKETEELLEIWQTNDRVAWTDEAFNVIQEILKERSIDLPQQNKPIFEHKEEEPEEDDNFSTEELKIIDDENPPAFYDPFEALLITKRIDWMAKIMIVFTIVYNILNFGGTMNIVRSYFFGQPNSSLVYLITALIMVLNTAFSIVAIYFPLKALAHILRILMEMEFKSRKAS